MSKASEWAARYQATEATRPEPFAVGNAAEFIEARIEASIGNDGVPVVIIGRQPPVAAWLAFARWLLDTFGDDEKAAGNLPIQGALRLKPGCHLKQVLADGTYADGPEAK